MDQKASLWQRLGIQDWFLTNEQTSAQKKQQSLTPDDVYNYVISKFNDSIRELSFADRVVFYHEYIISFNANDYTSFLNNRQGIFDGCRWTRSPSSPSRPDGGFWIRCAPRKAA